MWVSTPSPEKITASCVDSKSAKPPLDVKPEKSKRCFSVKEMETICENQITNNSSTLSKTDTFGVGTKCLSKSDVRLVESQIPGVKNGRDLFSKVSVKR